eukprot:12326815-Alexandrium_andersonii.AAC.1
MSDGVAGAHGLVGIVHVSLLVCSVLLARNVGRQFGRCVPRDLCAPPAKAAACELKLSQRVP